MKTSFFFRYSFAFFVTLLLLAFDLKEGKAGVLQTEIALRDSLLARLPQEKNDTLKIIILNDLATIYSKNGLYSLQLIYAEELLKLSIALKDEGHEIEAYIISGSALKRKGNFSEALKNYQKALAIAEKSKNLYAIFTVYNNIGVWYASQKDYKQTEKYYLKALKIAEKTKNEPDIILCLGNIARLYERQNNYDKALNYNVKILSIYERAGRKLYVQKKEERYCAIASIYIKIKNFDKAEEYLAKALFCNASSRSFKQKAIELGLMAKINIGRSRFDAAIKYFNDALAIVNQIEDSDIKRTMLFELSETFQKNKQYQEAFDYYKRAVAYKDSVLNTEKKEEIAQINASYELEKQKVEIEAEIKGEKRKQALKGWLFGSGLVLVLTFLIAALLFLMITRKQKKTITAQKQELQTQKNEVEEKNKDIMDSIHYAKRIQRALLREEEHISEHLPEHFILFMPRDVVSGDFYWAAEQGDWWYFAVADCTGHGVPGAIMSMLGISFLNDIIHSMHFPSPAAVLDQLRDKVVTDLRQTDESVGNRDGMDISLCCLNLKTLEMKWAGANNPLVIVSNGKLRQIKADKQPVGYYPYAKSFTDHNVQLVKGDTIYIYSDGYADQFGGPNGKKLTNKRFEALLTNTDGSMREQKDKLQRYFNEWKAGLEQVDDVCIVAVRV